MKKLISVLLCLVAVATCFVACSSKDTNESSTKSDVAIGAQGEITTKFREKKHTTTAASFSTTQSYTQVNTSKISKLQAIHLMQSYSDKELGVSKEDRDLSTFLVSDIGVQIKGEDYIKITLSKKIAHIDQDSGAKNYTVEEQGIYLLHYKGEKLYKQDIKTGKLSKMTLKEIPEE